LPPAFLRKLNTFAVLSQDDEQMLDMVTSQRGRIVAAREDVVRIGDRVQAINLIASGWACRYRMLPDGRRQIVSLILPGDICDLNIFVIQRMDLSIGAISEVGLREISREGLETLLTAHPRVRQALWWEQLVANSIQREWTVNLGQRTALERIAHLFCEIFTRLKLVGLTDGDSCELPLTQIDLGEITGLSAVHVNRTLQELRSTGLVVLRSRMLTIPNFGNLADAGLFDPGYLHLDHVGRHLDATE